MVRRQSPATARWWRCWRPAARPWTGSTRPLSPMAVSAQARPGSGPNIIRTITAPTCWTRTATSSAFAATILNSRRSDILDLAQIGAIAFGLHLVLGDETQRRRVDAVAQAAAIPGAIREHMAQMAVAVGGADLGADHAVRTVAQLVHHLGVDRLGEAGPAAAGFELVRRGK